VLVALKAATMGKNEGYQKKQSKPCQKLVLNMTTFYSRPPIGKTKSGRVKKYNQDYMAIFSHMATYTEIYNLLKLIDWLK